MKTNHVYLPDIVGKGYKNFWNFKGRYRVVKGSRASKKSKTAAIWYIVNLMKYPEANLLVVRKTGRSLNASCFTELCWAIRRLGVEHLWKINNTTMEFTYIPTGQTIYLRGLDDPFKITSITVRVGYLCFLWIEEAYEIMDEADFDILDESIRGYTGDCFKQITLTLNPWNDRHWIKRRFFDVSDPENILAITTNYMCNEWLDEADLKLFEDMKKRNPKRYLTAGLGEWGQTEGVIFDNWIVEDLTDLIPTFSNRYFGQDFGTQDPNATICINVDMGSKKIYIYDEFYSGNITLDTLANEILQRIGNSFITCDSAGAQQILELNNRGIWALPATKGANSILFGIQFLQGFDIIIHKDCKNFITEISNYVWAKDKFGKSVDKPADENNHLIDALRYAVEPLHFNTTATAARRL